MVVKLLQGVRSLFRRKTEEEKAAKRKSDELLCKLASQWGHDDNNTKTKMGQGAA